MVNEDEIINEPKHRCDFCNGLFNYDEMFKVDDLDVCESCHEVAIE